MSPTILRQFAFVGTDKLQAATGTAAQRKHLGGNLYDNQQGSLLVSSSSPVAAIVTALYATTSGHLQYQLESATQTVTTIVATVAPPEIITTTTTTFDAVLPDTAILIGFGIIVVVCAIAANVWANQVVPISRTKLAIAKQRNSNSTLRLYLDELLEIENGVVDQNNDTISTVLSAARNDLNSNIHENSRELDDTDRSKGDKNGGRFEASDRVFERWLFTDWLIKDSTKRKGGRQKEPALPVLKNAKWNSGDNPILVATLLIGLGVIFTSVTERITSVIVN